MTMSIGELRYFANHCRQKAEESRERTQTEAVPIRMVRLEELLDQLARECLALLDGPNDSDSRNDGV